MPSSKKSTRQAPQARGRASHGVSHGASGQKKKAGSSNNASPAKEHVISFQDSNRFQQAVMDRLDEISDVDMDEETHTYAVTRTTEGAVDEQTAVRSVSACTTLVQPSEAHFKATKAPVQRVEGLTVLQCRASAMEKWDAARDNGSAKHAELEKFCKGELKRSEEGEATVAFRKWLDRVCAPPAGLRTARGRGGEELGGAPGCRRCVLSLGPHGQAPASSAVSRASASERRCLLCLFLGRVIYNGVF